MIYDTLDSESLCIGRWNITIWPACEVNQQNFGLLDHISSLILLLDIQVVGIDPIAKIDKVGQTYFDCTISALNWLIFVCWPVTDVSGAASDIYLRSTDVHDKCGSLLEDIVLPEI